MVEVNMAEIDCVLAPGLQCGNSFVLSFYIVSDTA